MSSRSHDNLPTACFSVHAASDPSVMSRVLGLFAKRGLVPSRLHSDVTGPEGGLLVIDIQMTGMDAGLAGYMARCMRQIPAVECVLTSEKDRGSAIRQAG